MCRDDIFMRRLDGIVGVDHPAEERIGLMLGAKRGHGPREIALQHRTVTHRLDASASPRSRMRVVCADKIAGHPLGLHAAAAIIDHPQYQGRIAPIPECGID